MAAFQPLRTTEPQDDIEFCEGSDFEDADAEVFSEKFAPSECIRRSIREVHPQSRHRRWGLSVPRGPVAKWGGLLVLAAVGAAAVGGRSLVAGAKVRFKTAATRDAVMENGPMVAQTQQQQGAVAQHGCPCQCHNCGSCNCHHHGSVYVNKSVTVVVNTCSTVDCPKLSYGYTARFDAASLKCKNKECGEQDLNTCCVRRQTCAHLACSAEYVPDAGAAELLCADANCSVRSDLHLCCKKRATCGESMTCPDKYLPKGNADSILCQKSFCNIEEDLLICCQEAYQPKKASCATYTCPGYMYKRVGADTLECAATPCTSNDVETCCEKAGTCTDYTCPGDYVKKAGLSARFCKSSVCGQEDIDQCCQAKVTTSPKPRAPCNTMLCPSGTVKVPDADSELCEGSPCTSADAKVCCEAPPEPIPQDCSEMTCPTGTVLKADAGMISCGAAKCSDKDASICCEAKQKPTVQPPQMHCAEYLCEEGATNVHDFGRTVMCSMAGCDEETCCLSEAQVQIEKETTITIDKSTVVSVDVASQPMVCNLNCYTDVGATDVEITSEPGQPEPGTGLEACREACMYTGECQGITYKKGWIQGQGECLGKKEIHIAKCQPGGEYNTEILREHVMGKCALLGDPHVVQFDRPYGETINLYSTGDYRLIDSSVLQVDGRFDFTKRFPTAASCRGIALTGSIVQGGVLVAMYTGPDEWQAGYKVWWRGQRIVADYPSEFSDDVLVARFADMDPSNYHTDARHTIGGTSGRLPSFSFEFKQFKMSIYMLLGPDNVNLVIEMERLSVSMDGACGNFNCDEKDDLPGKMNQRGFGMALSGEQSIFSMQSDVQSVKVVQGTIAEDILQSCDQGLLEQGRAQCSKHLTENEATACLIDVCEAKSLSVAALDDALGNVEQQVTVDLERQESVQFSVEKTVDVSAQKTVDVSAHR